MKVRAVKYVISKSCFLAPSRIRVWLAGIEVALNRIFGSHTFGSPLWTLQSPVFESKLAQLHAFTTLFLLPECFFTV